MAEFAERLTAETTQKLSLFVQCICAISILVVMADVAARCLGIRARFVPECIVYVGERAVQPGTAPDRVPDNSAIVEASASAPGPNASQGLGLSVNVFELLLLFAAGAFVAVSKWHHTTLTYRKAKSGGAANVSDHTSKAVSWAQADICATLLTAVVGGYMLFTGVDRFLEMQNSMERDIRLARQTLRDLGVVHVNVDSLRVQFVDEQKHHHVSEEEARRQFDRMMYGMVDLKTKASVQIIPKIDSMYAAVTHARQEAPSRDSTAERLNSIAAELMELKGSIRRIEEHFGTEPAIPGRQAGNQ